MCSRTEAAPVREPGGCSHAEGAQGSVCHSCATVPAWLSLAGLTLAGAGTRAGCSVTSFPPTYSSSTCRRKGNTCHSSRAGCPLCAVPGQRRILFPALGRRNSSADPDPRHRLCAGIGAAPAPARSQRLPWHQRRELLFKTMFSIRA